MSRPILPLSRDEVLVVYDHALERDDFDRAGRLADLLLSRNDREEQDA